jgi:hypothetical protein
MNKRLAKAIVLVSVTLTACHEKDVTKSRDPEAVSACMDAGHSHDDYALVTKCEPLAPQEMFQGTWFVGFELSVFREGYAGVPAELGASLHSQYEIVAPASLNERVHAQDSNGASAYQVSFLGRQSLIPETKMMVADRIVSIRRVPLSPNFAERPN